MKSLHCGARARLLIVLPKWDTTPDKAKPAGSACPGCSPPIDPARTLAPSYPLEVTRTKSRHEPLVSVQSAAAANVKFYAPAVVQSISNPKIKPLVTDSSGRILLAQVENDPLYVLADPDLINNHGMGDERQAKAALAMLDFLNRRTQVDRFDVTTNGLGHAQSPLKLAFDPPFLAVTLTIFAALLLAAIHALTRFGSPRRSERAISFGKAALVDNSAALIRKAGREGATRAALCRRDSPARRGFVPAAACRAARSSR